MRAWVREDRLPGDASIRRYTRVWDDRDRSAIVAQYPAAVLYQLGRDLEVQAWCAAHGLGVPDLLEYDLASGRAVHEDFGPDDAERTLERRAVGERESIAMRCIDPLVELARLDPGELPRWNPPLAAERLRWELAGFELWFLRHRLGVGPTRHVTRWLDDLAHEIDTHPRRICHRDYHLNNLFILSDGSVGVIDYQDILVGPDTYDAVSLLGERGMPNVLSEAARERLEEAWATRTGAAPGWKARALLVRLQRGLKVLGTFARLSASGAGGYERWIAGLIDHLARGLPGAEAPSELTSLLLDLSRRAGPDQRERVRDTEAPA